jgi:hypothetical protein
MITELTHSNQNDQSSNSHDRSVQFLYVQSLLELKCHGGRALYTPRSMFEMLRTYTIHSGSEVENLSQKCADAKIVEVALIFAA